MRISDWSSDVCSSDLLVAGEAAALRLSDKGYVEGLDLADGSALTAGAVVLATGTFLGGRLFRGEERLEGGRIREEGATRPAPALPGVKLSQERATTGTVPHPDRHTQALGRYGRKAATTAARAYTH